MSWIFGDRNSSTLADRQRLKEILLARWEKKYGSAKSEDLGSQSDEPHQGDLKEISEQPPAEPAE
ncbi:hypothetical protein IFO70_32780 [Phormidium tenue FACHB-886]|nr:hypothetical protein [Phormidium tenue FACHB-886]